MFGYLKNSPRKGIVTIVLPRLSRVRGQRRGRTSLHPSQGKLRPQVPQNRSRRCLFVGRGNAAGARCNGIDLCFRVIGERAGIWLGSSTKHVDLHTCGARQWIRLGQSTAALLRCYTLTHAKQTGASLCLWAGSPEESGDSRRESFLFCVC